MKNSEITQQAIRDAARRRSHQSLAAALAEHNRTADEPGVLWRGKLALRGDSTEFDATIEVAPGGPAAFRTAEREAVEIESIDPVYWRRAVAAAV